MSIPQRVAFFFHCHASVSSRQQEWLVWPHELGQLHTVKCKGMKITVIYNERGAAYSGVAAAVVSDLSGM